MRGLFEVAAFQRHQPLIPAHVGPLVDGHGEMAVAEELAGLRFTGRNRCRHAIGIEPGAGPNLARRSEVDHQHAHRTVGLGLQDKAALNFQRRAEHDGEHDGLAEQFCHRRGIIVAGQDSIDSRAQPDDAAAQIERFHRKRQDHVVAAGLVGLANRNGEIRIAHGRRNISRAPSNFEPRLRQNCR